ncbi:hypothetical protein [Catellatospora sp. NPDC049609]|uniref:hypothetical protein n=1 Tax=Catellatospora sp. NPDC049609 TaxID=3155505 RepID=UPI00343C7D48
MPTNRLATVLAATALAVAAAPGLAAAAPTDQPDPGADRGAVIEVITLAGGPEDDNESINFGCAYA